MTGNKSILRVLNGFANLTDSEKSEFIQELNSYSKRYDKFNFQKEIRAKMDVGPTVNDYCKCCGKS